MKTLDGLKTHIIVGLYIAVQLAENGLGWDIPGVAPDPDWFSNVLTALGVSGFRDALRKVGGLFGGGGLLGRNEPKIGPGGAL